MRIAFVSSNRSWGGSELLWRDAAVDLARRGHDVFALKNRFAPGPRETAPLRAAGVRMVAMAGLPFLPRRLLDFIETAAPPLSTAWQALRLYIWLVVRRPALAIVSQGGNHDGWLLAAACRRAGVPYVLVCHKASDLYWPADRWMGHIAAAFEQARRVFFVSRHTRRLTEEQIGRTIERAAEIRNPFAVPWDAPMPWPEGDGLRLACVGRLDPKEKGQDMLLRVLARDTWRSRDVAVTFYGEGDQRIALERMAARLRLASVRFAGFEADVPAIWARHHGLVLASRAEGLPLVLVEAMLSGRVPVVTDVGGNGELVEEGRTGFLAAAASEDAVDAALERAWAGRAALPAIGAAAAAAARGLVPPDPAALFADALLRLADEHPLPAHATMPEYAE